MVYALRLIAEHDVLAEQSGGAWALQALNHRRDQAHFAIPIAEQVVAVVEAAREWGQRNNIGTHQRLLEALAKLDKVDEG